MKNIEVTYDALICENGTYEQGEAAFILPMTDELAAEYMAGRATDRGAVNLVETALEAVEVIFLMRGSWKQTSFKKEKEHGIGRRNSKRIFLKKAKPTMMTGSRFMDIICAVQKSTRNVRVTRKISSS